MCRKLFVLTMVVFLCVSFFNFGFAQDKATRFGVRIGSTVGQTNVELSGMSREVRLGLVAGGVFEYWTSQKFAIHTNLLYCTKGAKYSMDLLGMASADVTWTFNYLSIPVLAKIAFGQRTKFYLATGPEFGFLLSGKQKTETEILGTKEEDEEDLKDYMNSFEAGLAFGIGLEIPMGNAVFSIESRGSASLTDIFKEMPPEMIGEDKAVRNIVGSLSLGLAF